MSIVRRTKKTSIGVNIVPLIDVLVILLFFFILTMQNGQKNEKTLNIVLPTMQTAGKNNTHNHVYIGIDKEGVFFLSGQPVTQDELLQGIQDLARLSKKQSIILSADEHIQLHTLTFVMDACRKNGLDTIRLQTR